MKALVAAPGTKHRIAFRDVDEPSPLPDQAVVRVQAFSLNRGEVRNLAHAAPGARVGWDVAGVVTAAARDGSGPKAGARVVGLVRDGWAERVAMNTRHMASLPDEVDFGAASTLPVAGMTAMRALGHVGMLLGRRVLVTGASGGVGRFAVQLASQGGAHVVAVAGSEARGQGLRELGAREVVTGTIDGARGPFDAVLESVGGSQLAWALEHLAPGGTVVSFGNSSGEPTTFDIRKLYPVNRARLIGLILFAEIEQSMSAVGDLTTLAALLAAKKLDPQIGHTASWHDAPGACDALMGREIRGKAVLTVD